MGNGEERERERESDVRVYKPFNPSLAMSSFNARTARSSSVSSLVVPAEVEAVLVDEAAGFAPSFGCETSASAAAPPPLFVACASADFQFSRIMGMTSVFLTTFGLFPWMPFASTAVTTSTPLSSLSLSNNEGAAPYTKKKDKEANKSAVSQQEANV